MLTAAYIFEERFEGLRPGDEHRLTHLNVAFALVKDGKASVAHWKNPELIRKLIERKGSMKVVLSVGGWGAGGFSTAVSTAAGRDIFADSLVKIVDNYGFDGVDMDWEYPGSGVADIDFSPDDKVNYTEFIKVLRDKLPSKLITMAAGAFQEAINNLEIPKLVELMDFINLMTYDLLDFERVSHHTALHPSSQSSSISAAEAVELYHNAGVPHNKLVLGAAFYGRVYNNVAGLDKVADGSVPGFLAGGYAAVMEQAERAGGISFDQEAQAPYIYNAEERTFITFDNPLSLAAKCAYILELGLLGIMFWEYNSDDERGSLLKAIEEAS